MSASDKAPTYRDIAREAGVSSATVSLALREHPSIPATTRARVVAVAKRMGYRVNPLVAALMASRRAASEPTLQALFAAITIEPVRKMSAVHPGVRLVIEGARARAREHGYGLDEISLESASEKHRDLESVLQARGITGLILFDEPEMRCEVKLDWQRYTVCAIGNMQLPERFHVVVADHFQVMDTAVTNLLSLGYRRIGAVWDGAIQTVTGRRYEAALALHRSGPEGGRFVRSLLGGEVREGEVLRWVEAERPDAIVISDHRVAVWLERRGVKIPEQVAIAHTDVTSGWRPYAGVNQGHAEKGATAVDVLVAQCHRNDRGPTAHPMLIQFPGAWQPGPSARTAAPGE